MKKFRIKKAVPSLLPLVLLVTLMQVVPISFPGLKIPFIGASSAKASVPVPDPGTNVAWTTGNYFDSFSSQSGVTSTDLSNSSNPSMKLNWQMYYAHEAITINSSGVIVGFNTFTSASGQIDWYVAVSQADDTMGSWNTPTLFSKSYAQLSGSAGTLITSSSEGTTILIPAKRYFLIGARKATTRTYKALSTNRTAQIGSQNIVTSINRTYVETTEVLTGTPAIPSAVGGASTGFTTIENMAPVWSIKFSYTAGSLTDSTLSGLTGVLNTSDFALKETFARSTLSYSWANSLNSNYSLIKIKATAFSPFSTLQFKVNNGSYSALTSGVASESLTFDSGYNTIYIQVTPFAADGTPTIYSVEVFVNGPNKDSTTFSYALSSPATTTSGGTLNLNNQGCTTDQLAGFSEHWLTP